MEYVGCGFIAFGMPAALFIVTIARDPLRVLVLMASAFFWLVSLLLSSMLWFAVVPLREKLAFGVVFSVLFQELFRYLFFLLMKKAHAGLNKLLERDTNAQPASLTLVHNRHLLAYVAGLGFGIIGGAFSMVNVLADMSGPGTIGLHGDSDLFFIVSSLATLCFVLLHTFWGIIFFNGMSQKCYHQVAVVVASHMLVSCLSLLNQDDPPMYIGSMIPMYSMMGAMAVWAFIIAGGRFGKILEIFPCMPHSYNVN
ncbi:Gamma-secretase subunit Aph-1b [Lamellibrachia satsuma]|nr:Gamma-secretase subunit Aph-1b [Lamellibrachia satsuma]